MSLVSKQLLHARWIAPMDGPMLEDATIVFTDRILDIGNTAQMRREHPDAIASEPVEGCILPGLINPHTHLELSHMRQPPTARPLADWLVSVAPQSAAAAETGETGIEIGIRQCLHFGVTTVGDITARPESTRPILAKSPLRVISFGEVRAMGQKRRLLEPRLNDAIATRFNTSRFSAAVSPHAPYSIEPDGYRQCLHAAQSHGMQLTTHLAESPDEADFLANHAGPFRRLWDHVGGWDEQIPRFTGGPIRYAQFLGLLDHPTLLAHVNYIDDDELEILARGQASVVYCPRTHAWFNHAPHRWRDMLARGIPVAIGTDSAASSGDLNLMADLRLVHAVAPDVPPEILWTLVTSAAATVLGLQSSVGSLTPGKFADFVIFPMTREAVDKPLQSLLETDALPQQVWIGGQRIFQT